MRKPILVAAAIAVVTAIAAVAVYSHIEGVSEMDVLARDTDELLREIRVDRHVAAAGRAFTASGEAASWEDTVAHMGRGCDSLGNAVENAYGAMRRSLAESQDSCIKARDAAARFDLDASMQHAQVMVRTMQEAARGRQR